MATKKSKKQGGRNTPEHNKAARIRRKIRGGKEVSVDDLEWLKTYEANKKAPGRPVAPITEASDEDDDADDTQDEDDDGPDLGTAATGERDAPIDPPIDPAPVEAPIAPTVRPSLPPPPKLDAPPRVRTETREEARGDKRKEDWRDKYRGDNKTASREGTVLLVADQWSAVLDAMASQMRDIGVDPIVEPAHLKPAIVLFLDDVLPEIEITPMHLAIGGSTALLMQRFMKRKQIAEHVQREKEKADHVRANTERRERAERAQAAAEEMRANAERVEAERAQAAASEPIAPEPPDAPEPPTGPTIAEYVGDPYANADAVINNPTAVF